MLQPLNVLLVVRGPKLNTVLKMWPHQCWVQWDNHFTALAGHTIPDTSQDVVGLLGHLGTLLAHVKHELYETAIKPKAVLSSVAKPRNLTYWEWVFPQRLPAEWGILYIYSVIKIIFFHYIFYHVFFFPLLWYSASLKEVSLYLSTQKSWDITWKQ